MECVFVLHCWQRITYRSASQLGKNDRSLISRIDCCFRLWMAIQKSKSRLLSNKSTWCHRCEDSTFTGVSQPSHLSRRLKFSVVAGRYPQPLPAMLILLWSRALNSSRNTLTFGNRHIRARFYTRPIFGEFMLENYLHMMFWLLRSPAQATRHWVGPRSPWLGNPSWATPATYSSALRTLWLITCRQRAFSKTCRRSEIHWHA